MEKTLGDIIEDLKDNKKVDYDELRYAFLALESLRAFETMDLRKVCGWEEEPKIFGKKYVLENYSKRACGCMNAIPKKWLGDDLPENESYQKFHALGKKLFDKFLDKKENSKN